jgi:hypothetical protein
LCIANLTGNIQKAVAFTLLIAAALNVFKAISSGVQGLWLSFGYAIDPSSHSLFFW